MREAALPEPTARAGPSSDIKVGAIDPFDFAQGRPSIATGGSGNRPYLVLRLVIGALACLRPAHRSRADRSRDSFAH